MDYLVYIEHNAENLQFYLWYRDYERRFNALPETEKALSKEWVPEAKEIPNLAKDAEKEAGKTKRSAIKSMMENGYDSKGAALFTEDREVTAAEDRHASIFRENASTIAPSFSDSTATPSTAEVTAQAGLKWQPCEPIPADWSYTGCSLTVNSYSPAYARGGQSRHAPLPRLHLTPRTEPLSQGPLPMPACPPTYHPPLGLRACRNHR